jgi:HEAT repeat protein
MHPANLDQRLTAADRRNPLLDLPVAVEVQPDRELDRLLADLTPDTPWGDRQIAAQKLGRMRCVEALPGLLSALRADPFWMVRCAIIQALEMIADPQAIPTLQQVAEMDSFQVVRSYAFKAVERLSRFC